MEMAENLKEAGLDVTLIEAGTQLLAPFDPEMASVLAKELEERGIRLLFSERVQSFLDDGTSIHVHMEHGGGDLDRAIASFIIANGAASSGKKVTMFFTFWGLNVIRKPERIHAKKSFMGRMFSRMMPRGSRKLPLSKMNMMGMGPKMIRGVMSSHNISSLEELIETAIAQGVEIVACQMSMDLMGITKEELLDGVKIGGVGYYLGKADHSGINLFV